MAGTSPQRFRGDAFEHGQIHAEPGNDDAERREDVGRGGRLEVRTKGTEIREMTEISEIVRGDERRAGLLESGIAHAERIPVDERRAVPVGTFDDDLRGRNRVEVLIVLDGLELRGPLLCEI